MKKNKFLTSVAALFFALALTLTACTQDVKNTSSDNVSSKIAVLENQSVTTDDESSSREQESSSIKDNSSKKENSSKQSATDKITSDLIENITITPPIPKPQKTENVSSESEDDYYEIDLGKYESQPSEIDADKQLILGGWAFEHDVSYLLRDEGYTVTEPVIVKYYYEFINEYSCVLYPAKQDYYDKIGPFMIPGIERQLIAELKKDWITESEFKQMMGMTTREYAAYLFSEVVKYMPSTKMGYIFRDGKLCIKNPDTNQYDKYDYQFVDDNTLILTKTPFEHHLKRVIKQDNTASE